MRQIKNLIPILCLLLTAYSCNPTPMAKEGIADLQAAFANPSKEFRSAPFWVWNDNMNKETINRMLTEFKEQGFGGAFLHPRYGLTNEYLSKEWFDLFEYSVEKGKELGLNIWIYDENSYPSGFAGGNTPALMPESYNQGVGIKPFIADILPDTASSMFVVLAEKNGTFENITSSLAAHKGKPGKYFMYEKTFYRVSPWNADHSYVDLMVKGVTEKFLEITMKGYEERGKKNFGSYVPGIFTDEPEINAPGGSYRWTPDLFPLFKETYGYDLEINLPSLHEEVGNFRRVRHDYHELLLKLFIDRWAKPCYDYCARNNLVWTGHYWEHNWPRVHGGPDNMAMAAYQQMPGIDMLFNQFDENRCNAQFGNVRAVKEVRSVANQLGRKRILSETYGGAGWEITFKDQKRLGDWEYVLGVNFLNQHLSHASYIGCRKYDYPPMFTSAAPWWDNYKVLNDYYARLSVALTQGEQINEILVLEPTTSIWLYHQFAMNNDKIQEIGIGMQAMITAMEKRQVEYDLGCEDIIKNHGIVDGKRFDIGRRSYTTVVIPKGVENLEMETFKLLEQFVANGGRVVSLAKPTYIDGVENEMIKALFSQPSIVNISDWNDQTLAEVFPANGVKFEQKPGGNLMHQRRYFKDGQLFFFANVDMEKAASTKVIIDAVSVIELDAFDGKSYKYAYDNASKSFEITLEPAESKLIWVSNGTVNAQERVQPTQLTALKADSPLAISREKDNILAIDYVDLTMGGTTTKQLNALEASFEAFKKAGFPRGNPWFMAIQYKQAILERDTFQANGFTATYRFNVEAKGADLSSAKLAVERPWLYTIKLNGKTLSSDAKEFIFDKEMKLIPTEGAVKQGENIIELIAPKFSVHAEIEPVYVVGNFDVNWNDKSFYITAPAPKTALTDWKSSGSPFYPYGMNYTKEYTISGKEGKGFVITAKNWNGTVAEVYVNGAKSGIIYSNPYTLDITQFLKEGANSVELRVLGGMENMIGPFHTNPNGLTGPHSWRNIKSVNKPEAYRITPYGLFEEFTVSSYTR